MLTPLFQPNVITCPHCHNSFENNIVNGITLVDIVGRIESRKRVFCRLSLDTIERLDDEGRLDFKSVKKIVLDTLNDFNRDVETLLGWGLEAE